MKKFIPSILIIVLIVSFLFPITSFGMFKLHYIPTAICLILGLYILIMPSDKRNNLQIAYNFSKTAFLILLLLSVVYVFRSDSLFSDVPRNLREHTVYMALYGYIFVFTAIIIKFKAIYSIKLAKAINVYLFLYYIVQTISARTIPHNAYIACIGMLIFSNGLYKLLYSKRQNISFLITIIQVITFISMPILAYLRGASFTTIVILATQLLFQSHNRVRNISILIVISVLTMFLFSSNYISTYFKDNNTYEYESVLQMSDALDMSDENKNIRFVWVQETIEYSISSPLIGYVYNYTFPSFNNSISGAAGLHNYYLSMIVDTGYITFFLYLCILLLATFNGIKRIRSGDTTCIIYISWNIALISTYSTNCYGHIWSTSSVMGLLHAYAIVKLLTPSPKNPNKNNSFYSK